MKNTLIKASNMPINVKIEKYKISSYYQDIKASVCNERENKKRTKSKKNMTLQKAPHKNKRKSL